MQVLWENCTVQYISVFTLSPSTNDYRYSWIYTKIFNHYHSVKYYRFHDKDFLGNHKCTASHYIYYHYSCYCYCYYYYYYYHYCYLLLLLLSLSLSSLSYINVIFIIIIIIIIITINIAIINAITVIIYGIFERIKIPFKCTLCDGWCGW